MAFARCKKRKLTSEPTQGVKVEVGTSEVVVVVAEVEEEEVVVDVVVLEEEEEVVEELVEDEGELADELGEEVVGAGALLVVDLVLEVVLERGFVVVVVVILRGVVVVGLGGEGGARICFTTDLIASLTSPRLANSTLSSKSSSGNSSTSLLFQA